MRTPEEWLQYAKWSTGRPDEETRVDPSGPPASLMALSAPAPMAGPAPGRARVSLPTKDLLRSHIQLHREYGDSPDAHTVAAERMFSAELKARGMPHRHHTMLAEAAGTQEDRRPLDIAEVHAYADDALHIESDAVSLVRDETGVGKRVYLKVSKALKPLARTILSKVNRSLPASVNLQLTPDRRNPGRLAHITSMYDLQLVRNVGPSRLTSWDKLAEAEASAAAGATDPESDNRLAPPAEVVKALTGLSVSLDHTFVCKAATANLAVTGIDGPAEEHIVTGVVLEPDVIDKTRVELEDGSRTLGDVYDEDVVRAACYYYMENSRAAAWYHTKQGGSFLREQLDTTLLENYVAPCDITIGGRAVRRGSWVQTWRINNEQLWYDVKSGKIKAFSIGSFSRGVIEEIPEAAQQ